MKLIKFISLSIAIAAGGGIIALGLLASSRSKVTNPVSPIEPLVALVDRATLAALPIKNGSTATTSRLASGMMPPTNSWISGMVLQPTPLAVYPMPLSFLAKDTGFEFGLPTVQSTNTMISGSHVAGMVVGLDGATDFQLDRYDKVLARLNYRSHGQSLGSLTLAQGSPFVFYRAIKPTTLTISKLGLVASGNSSSYLRYSSAGHDYALTASQGAIIKLSGATASVAAPGGSLVTMYGLPVGRLDQLRAMAGNELTGVTVTSAQNKTEATTTFEYKTIDNQPTVFAPMSYSQLATKASQVGTYDSIYGPMIARQGLKFTTTVPVTEPSNQLDLAIVSAIHRQQLIASLNQDVAVTTITAQDSYFAGKQLARAANLLDISEQLGQTATSQRLKSILSDGFAKRLGANFFYYDPTLKGIAAQTKSFGSEDFNDHHFHYGYFIYAASIFGRYDSDFLAQHQKQINLLVADIAAYTATNTFPLQRYFDPYSAHSWAAGLSPFADGNNQESSSEAINAYNGVAKWGQLINNPKLTDSAEWMLSNEAATAKSAWRTVDTSSADLKNYSSPLTSLNFGGKRTYSTFFSNESGAKLGIQLLPLSPAMLSFTSDGAVIDASVKASITGNNFNVALGDYDLMYLALRNPQQAVQLVAKQKDTFIDDGNSRTYLEAWTFYLTDK